MNRLAVLSVLGVVASGCVSDLDEEWQLDHDRVIAVRATPPSIVAGGRSELDGFLAVKGSTTVEQVPQAARVVAPASLASALTMEGGTWVVTAPDEATLAAVRIELKLAADAPVPLQIGLVYPGPPGGVPPTAEDPGDSLVALKTVKLGTAADNPVLAEPLINGMPAPADEIVVGKLVDVPFSIAVGEDDEVTWLTSCGTLHDFDLPEAYLRVEQEDPTEGQLAVVVRDDRGGVSWRVWSIRAE